MTNQNTIKPHPEPQDPRTKPPVCSGFPPTLIDRGKTALPSTEILTKWPKASAPSTVQSGHSSQTGYRTAPATVQSDHPSQLGYKTTEKIHRTGQTPTGYEFILKEQKQERVDLEEQLHGGRRDVDETLEMEEQKREYIQRLADRMSQINDAEVDNRYHFSVDKYQQEHHRHPAAPEEAEGGVRPQQRGHEVGTGIHPSSKVRQ